MSKRWWIVFGCIAALFVLMMILGEPIRFLWNFFFGRNSFG